MPRPHKPYWKASHGQYASHVGGRETLLGPDLDEAWRELHRLLGDRRRDRPHGADPGVVAGVVEPFLDFVERHRKPSTYDFYLAALTSFAKHIGPDLRLSELKAHHVSAWQDAADWSPDTRRGYVSAVQRALRWAYDEELIDRLPFRRLPKPKARRREATFDAGDWERIIEAAASPFRELLLFCRATGCRPEEARIVERRHLVGIAGIYPRLAIIETERAKGQRKPRAIYVPTSVRPMVEELADRQAVGPIFRNSRGQPWTKNAVVCRWRRLRQRLGIEGSAYTIRHTWVTQALLKLPVQTVAQLAGHDPRTAMAVYGHLGTEIEAMLDAADRAAG